MKTKDDLKMLLIVIAAIMAASSFIFVFLQNPAAL